jgi:hypothetical protein
MVATAVTTMCKCCGGEIWSVGGQRHVVSIFRVEACRAWLYRQVGRWSLKPTQGKEMGHGLAWQKPICRDHRKNAILHAYIMPLENGIMEKDSHFQGHNTVFHYEEKMEL